MIGSEKLQGQPKTVLVGTGVVGRAILHAHVAAGVSVCVADQDPAALDAAVNEVVAAHSRAQVTRLFIEDESLSIASIVLEGFQAGNESAIVIESIAEQLDVKQAFFAKARRFFGRDAILCSNTSTLRIEDIAADLPQPGNVCGMHFFMPVDRRSAVEIVRAKKTNESTIGRCEEHARQINKSPLVVADRPGFIVNRLLSPYLNQSLLLLARGVSHEQIEQAAIAYGMPMSPLELIDYIGTRTMFSAGRCFYQAFPDRLDPSLIVPRLVKKKQFGRDGGAGLYRYEDGVRSDSLAATAAQIVAEYSTRPIEVIHQDVVDLLAVPMWIEAALAFRDGVTNDLPDFDLAMRGGLGFQSDMDKKSGSWLGFFDSLGSSALINAIEKWSLVFKSMQAPPELVRLLKTCSASVAIERYASLATGKSRKD